MSNSRETAQGRCPICGKHNEIAVGFMGAILWRKSEKCKHYYSVSRDRRGDLHLKFAIYSEDSKVVLKVLSIMRNVEARGFDAGEIHAKCGMPYDPDSNHPDYKKGYRRGFDRGREILDTRRAIKYGGGR